MKVSGEDAAKFNAVDQSSFLNVNQGTLTYADEDTGEVKWKDRTDTEHSKTLGPHAIRIIRRLPYGR